MQMICRKTEHTKQANLKFATKFLICDPLQIFLSQIEAVDILL